MTDVTCDFHWFKRHFLMDSVIVYVAINKRVDNFVNFPHIFFFRTLFRIVVLKGSLRPTKAISEFDLIRFVFWFWTDAYINHSLLQSQSSLFSFDKFRIKWQKFSFHLVIEPSQNLLCLSQWSGWQLQMNWTLILFFITDILFGQDRLLSLLFPKKTLQKYPRNL